MKCFEKERRMTAHFETKFQDSTETLTVSKGFGWHDGKENEASKKA
jgi:hypothetical protein